VTIITSCEVYGGAENDKISLHLSRRRRAMKNAQGYSFHGCRRVEPSRARSCSFQILEILDYFTSADICHHDLSPDKFRLLSKTISWPFDLAFVTPVPRNKQGGHRTLMTPRTLEPEFTGRRRVSVIKLTTAPNRAFDSASYDLWSSCHSLQLVDQSSSVQIPTAEHSYRYFILE
jgi:hypothetical protein